MRSLVTLREAFEDERLLGNVLPGPSWKLWRTMLIAAQGEPLMRDERRLFAKYTGRAEEPGVRIDEGLFVVGRRGGKDKAASTLACYVAALNEHPELSAGEKGLVLLLAPDQRQAAVTLAYIEAAFEVSPVLKPMVVSRTQDTIELSNGISIEVRSANFRRIRGLTAVAIIGTESAFWMDNETGSANADTEILNAARPMLSTTGGPLLLISSPYSRRGETWSIYKANYGPEGDPRILVVQGSSKDFNPNLPDRVIARAYERDAIAAAAEYGAQFRSDLEAFISREVLEAAVSVGVFERPRLEGIEYYGFCDPSGGARDSFCAAVAHVDGDKVVLDGVRERKAPLSPSATVAEQAAFFRSFGVGQIAGDRYSGEFVRELFRKEEIQYVPTALTKSDIYMAVLGPLNSGLVELLDNATLVSQFAGLERRTGRGGSKDAVDHAPGARDDLCNAAAGAIEAAFAALRRPEQLIGEPPRFFKIGRPEPTWIS